MSISTSTSLMSMLTTGTQASTDPSYGSLTLNAAVQKALAAAEAKATGTSTAATTTSASDQSTVSISAAALAASAAKADNAKDFATLSNDVRTTLDAQYATAKAAGKATTPDLSAMSGRAVAAVALNTSGRFTPTEVAAAKTEMSGRMRNDFLGTAGGSTGMTGMVTYSKQLVTRYDSMSREERQVRGWTDQTRTNAETFADTANTASLWDQLNAQ